jgi:long-chain acyl-CoA synthetase
MPASSPLDRFLRWEKEIPNDIFLRQPFNGQWKKWTWADAGLECRKIANALQLSGIAPGSHVAILSKNCAHWVMADLAIMMGGYVSVPIYPSLSAASIQPILQHSDTKAVIIGKLDDYDHQQAGIPQNIMRISIEAYSIHTALTWEKYITQLNPIKEIALWKRDDVLTIIYTSGTTGNAKGVMHTVSAVDAVLQAVIAQLKFEFRFQLFSYLPLSHIAERLAIEMNGIYNGCTISFAESLASFAENLADTQPHCFLGVPRIWAKFREGVLKKIPQKKLNLLLTIPFLNTMMKKSIRKKLGLSRATTVLCGAAPIGVELLSWFDKLGIKILVAYGMTEDCVYNHLETHSEYRMGSVGKALPKLKINITAEGEIRVKSEGNMKGYYKQPELTADAFDEEGYLKTGDIGEYDRDGFLFITGRVKDQFKTDKGKYVSPSPIEIKLQANTDIEQVCVVGMGIPQPIALINLSEAGKLKSTIEISGSLANTLAALNPLLESFERIEKAVIMKEDWTIENGLMTPSLKIKRNLVEKGLYPSYQKWYAAPEKIVWQ